MTKYLPIKTDQIKKQFAKETGIAEDQIAEIVEWTPPTTLSIITKDDQRFNCRLTYDARAKSGSFWKDDDTYLAESIREHNANA